MEGVLESHKRKWRSEFRASVRPIFTHTTSSSAFSLSSFAKSSLLTTGPPDFSLQLFSFQFFTQLVTPATQRDTTVHHMSRGGASIMPPPVWLTIDGEHAVRVENQLLNVPLFGLLQRSAGGLAHTHINDTENYGHDNIFCCPSVKQNSKTELWWRAKKDWCKNYIIASPVMIHTCISARWLVCFPCSLSATFLHMSEHTWEKEIVYIFFRRMYKLVQ